MWQFQQTGRSWSSASGTCSGGTWLHSTVRPSRANRAGLWSCQWIMLKTCSYCGQPFSMIHWHDHKPALLALDGRTVEWSQVPPEQVPEALDHDRPVCWKCHIAETIRHEHPDQVV